MLLNAFYMLGNAIILFGILLLLCRVILRISETDNQTEHSLKRVFLTCVLVLFVLWLPYYISMWPATIHGDFLMQRYYSFFIILQCFSTSLPLTE